MATAKQPENKMDPKEGIRRVREIATLLDRSVRSAVQRRGVMDAGNRTIGKLHPSHGAHAYNILHATLARNLTIDVVAAFDWSPVRTLEKQTKASVPALVHHLRLPEVADHLLAFSRRWDGLSPDQNEKDCGDALSRIEKRYSDCCSDLEFQDGLSKLRQVRDYRVAHNLFDNEPPEPTYAELSLILDNAKDFAADGLLAVIGRGQDYEGAERQAASSARDLWTRGLTVCRPSATEAVVSRPPHIDGERERR